MSEYFNSINPENTPDDETPQLDAEYWSTTAEGLMPGEIVHPHPYSSLRMDTTTKKLYIKANAEFDSDTHTPPPNYYGERFGLLRVYMPDEDGDILDGFIADIRPLAKGGISTETINTNADTYASLLAAYGSADEYMPVLGYVFTDFEGGTSYKGLDQLKHAAQFLAENVDQVREPSSGQTAEKSASEKEALGEMADILGITLDDSQPESHSETPIADALEAIKEIQNKPQNIAKTSKKPSIWPWNR